MGQGGGGGGGSTARNFWGDWDDDFMPGPGGGGLDLPPTLPGDGDVTVLWSSPAPGTGGSVGARAAAYAEARAAAEWLAAEAAANAGSAAGLEASMAAAAARAAAARAAAMRASALSIARFLGPAGAISIVAGLEVVPLPDEDGWIADENTIDPYWYIDPWGIYPNGSEIKIGDDGTPADDMTPEKWDPNNPKDIEGHPLPTREWDDYSNPYGYEDGTARPWDGGIDPGQLEGDLWDWDRTTLRYISRVLQAIEINPESFIPVRPTDIMDEPGNMGGFLDPVELGQDPSEEPSFGPNGGDPSLGDGGVPAAPGDPGGNSGNSRGEGEHTEPGSSTMPGESDSSWNWGGGGFMPGPGGDGPCTWLTVAELLAVVQSDAVARAAVYNAVQRVIRR